MSEQSREHVRASRHSGNIQETRTLCENARSARKYPITKRIVAYQQGAHVQGDVQRDSERELEKRRGRATPESRPGESYWRDGRKSERCHLSTEKCILHSGRLGRVTTNCSQDADVGKSILQWLLELARA